MSQKRCFSFHRKLQVLVNTKLQEESFYNLLTMCMKNTIESHYRRSFESERKLSAVYTRVTALHLREYSRLQPIRGV